MAAKYEVEVKVLSATNLKNVNWKNGPLRPYIVAWLDADSSAKVTTSVAPLADSGPDGADPIWDADDDARAKMVLQLPRHADLDETALLIDVVHAKDDGKDVEKVKPLVGSARIALRDVLEEVGIGEKAVRAVRLKRPSGRPQGVLELKICVREPPSRYGYYESHPPPASGAAYYGAAGGGYPANPASRDTSYGYGAPAQPPAGYPYGSAAPAPTAAAGYGGYGAPPAGYPAYGAAPPAGYAAYGAAPPAGYAAYGAAAPAVAPVAEKKKSKFGVGTGVAVGAAAGLIGGIAIAEGIDHIKDDIAEDAAEKVEDDLADEYGGYDDDF